MDFLLRRTTRTAWVLPPTFAVAARTRDRPREVIVKNLSLGEQQVCAEKEQSGPRGMIYLAS
jgi:hypothetical protein